jgi:hypothetical protein
MFLSLFFFFILVTITTSITLVPGTIHVRLLPDNQISNGSYQPSSTVYYLVELEDVPIDDNVHIGVEIRGSNPSGAGPRGYIVMAHDITPITEFLKETKKPLEFQLTPDEIFAGYSWFLRPFVFFTNESMVSTNMMNSGASEMFTVLQQ